VTDREPFPLSTAIDALVEADETDEWIATVLPEDEVRRCLQEAVAQLRWLRRNLGD
jgi:hypothetical protein